MSISSACMMRAHVGDLLLKPHQHCFCVGSPAFAQVRKVSKRDSSLGGDDSVLSMWGSMVCK